MIFSLHFCPNISLVFEGALQLVGTNSSGCNAFFVRNDVAENLTEISPEVAFNYGRFKESKYSNKNILYDNLNYRNKLNLIKNKVIYDLDKKIETIISNKYNL